MYNILSSKYPESYIVYNIKRPKKSKVNKYPKYKYIPKKYNKITIYSIKKVTQTPVYCNKK